MKQFAIIGLSTFGQRMLDELIGSSAEILIVDRDREVIDLYRDQVTSAYVADVLKEETIRKIIPAEIDAVIIDLGDRVETSILLVHYLKKLGVRRIIAKAETDEHGEILEIVGAHQVVFPNKEAARRVAPPLVLSTVFNYMPISKGLVMAEVGVPPRLLGKSLIEADLRRNFKINAIAVSRSGQEEYEFVSPAYVFTDSDILLVVGREEDLSQFSTTAIRGAGRRDFVSVMKRFFGRNRPRQDAQPSSTPRPSGPPKISG